MTQSARLIEIKVRQMSSTGMADGLITVPFEAIDWFGTINEREVVSVRGEKFTVKDMAKLAEDMKAAGG